MKKYHISMTLRDGSPLCLGEFTPEQIMTWNNDESICHLDIDSALDELEGLHYIVEEIV
jgi:hypothetical protein